ncbi:C-type lectin-like protein [Fowlpox virus]|nr:C-type lectin-like protein [Fowlpox virus]
MEDDKCNKVTLCWVLIPCGSIIIALSVLVIIFSISPPPHDLSRFSCDMEWIGYNKKCYYFSNTTNNKSFAEENCKNMKSVLAYVNNKNELDFMLRYKESDDYWLGMERKNVNASWSLGDGKSYTKTVDIQGNGTCAFLGNNKTISSAACNIPKKWICCIILPTV